ncbi:hypothetical protein GQ457_05G026960 [Hibiscus cannabinus]
MVMSRMNIKRAWAGTWRTNIAPRALQKLERNMENSTHCRLVWNGDGGFEKPETYISEWYSKDKYLASYNHILQPVRGKKFWSKGLSPILPPKVKKLNSGKYTRAGIKITCSVCKAIGHNKRNQEKNMVESSATNSINDRSFNKRKKVIGIGLYTDLQTGEQIMNPGMESERVVIAPAIVPKKIGAHTSQFQHRWKDLLALVELEKRVEDVTNEAGVEAKVDKE